MEWTLRWIAKSFPQPVGPYQVGYHDLLTPGLPDASSLLRILYPAAQDTPRPINPPLWTDSSPKDACINFMECMVLDWPSWVPNSEFLFFPLVRALLRRTALSSIFSAFWTMFADRLTLPTIPGAPVHPPPSIQGWPVVVFSHGMGCSRATMSQLTYQLASQGVVVISLEHREGSGCASFYRKARGAGVVEIPHRCLMDGEDELTVREGQVKHRGKEILRVLDLLEQIQAGESIDNVFTSKSRNCPSPLAGSLDLSSLYLMGHSYGGASVLLVASMIRESRVRLAGVIALDPWMFPVHKMELRVTSPLCVINSEAFCLDQNVKAVQEAVEDSCQDVEWEVLTGGVHLSATDLPMLFPQDYLRKCAGFMTTVRPEEAIKKLNRFIWDFISRRMVKAKKSGQ